MRPATANALRDIMLVACLLGAVPLTAAAALPVDAPAIDKPLVAYWDFDEPIGATCSDRSGNGHHATPARPGGVERVEGVFGNALSFSGTHLLQTPGGDWPGELRALSVSAWVLPTQFETYNEIFRKEDGSQRVLFSFQNEGTILSLGLNINGYIECDAKTDPKALLDGNWHHCAASFDGQDMRVYLDGTEIGSTHRPGKITSGGMGPGCIGNTNGGELFQGLMDDVRIYASALTAQETALLHAKGLESLASRAEVASSAGPSVNKPLLAHWTFDEPGITAMVRDVSGNPDAQVTAGAALLRSRGVHGRAAQLAGAHTLQTSGGFGLDVLPSISFSAWVRPTDLRGYREVFRKEDGDRRLLFSFQADGTILSLGLNVGGYVECDAEIAATDLLDGQWHHCAGTFDGQAMRVYLDGREVGMLEQAGTIRAGKGANGFIGSNGGTSEHFQGMLDDLRIYRAALAPDEVAAIYEAGRQALGAFDQQLRDRLAAYYVEQDSFAATLAASRRAVSEKRGRIDLDLAGALVRALRSRFPDDYARLADWTKASPIEFLAARDSAFQTEHADRLMELMVEYRPLTEAQKSRLTPDDVRNWKAAEAIQARYEKLKAAGDGSQFSPEWVTLMLEAGKRIDFRPYQNEPVAPYVRPQTPETRNLTAGEAREQLERDWLHQAGNNPSPERIVAEIGWALALADRIETTSEGAVSFAAERKRLTDLREQAKQLDAPDSEMYFQVREVKREIAFRNPVVDFSSMLFVDMPFPQGSEWPHETRHRLGYMSVPGARLLVLEGLSPSGSLRQLMPMEPLHGAFWRPDLSFDAQKVVFCFRPHNEKSFHLYEVNLDGSGLRQLTDGPYDDLDPIYLPDGEHIIFSTTRGHTYVRCMPPTNAFVLARCDADGRNVYLVSSNNEPDYLPSVMNDGRVIYTRWEYTDKPLWRAQSLWTVSPDGTRPSTFWGNQTVWPDLLKDARCIPDSRRVMFTGSAHHNWFAGSVGIIDPDRGFNFPDGLTKVTADLEWPECGDGPVDPVECADYHSSGSYAAYYSPYPLSEEDFLVSANRNGKFVLYLMDVYGNRELIYEGASNIFHALPIRPRPVPPVLPDLVKWPSREERLNPAGGVIYSKSVYQGAPEKLRGKARFLRVLSIEPKTYTYWNKRPYISTGPVVSMLQSEGVKRVLGTVPIEKDGSVAFNVPPGQSLHFQLLDGNYRALQTMRSFANVMPGETRGCLGCHELHSTAPMVGTQPTAFASGPRDITPPPWGDDTVSYGRYVQPVLDRYCGSCHQGEGKAREVLDLTRRPGYAMFDEPYVTLIGRPTWGTAYQQPDPLPPGFGIAAPLMVEGYEKTDPEAYRTPEPMTRLSFASPLIDIASSGKHHGVKVDEVSRRRLIAWIDAMCPYSGDEEIRQIPDPDFQGIDWIAIRPRIATAPRIVRPGPVD